MRYDKIKTYYIMNLPLVIALCIVALCFDGLMSLIPILEGKMINALDQGLLFQDVLKNSLIFIGLVLFVQINRFFKRYLVRVFSHKITITMRDVSFRNLMQKDMQYFITHSRGDILNKNLTDIDDTSEGIRKLTTEFFDTIVLLIGYLIAMLIMDWKITIIAIIFITLSIMASSLIKRLVYKVNKEYKEYYSFSKNETINYIENEFYYRGFGSHQEYNNKYAKTLDNLEKKSIRSMLSQSSLEPVYQVIGWLGLALIIVISGKNVMNQVYNIGTLTAILTTYMLSARKAARVGKIFNAYQKLRVSWGRCREYLVEPSLKEVSEVFDNSGLVVSNYTFGFSSSFKVSNLSFTASKGEHIGVCGKVHTGKSTLLGGLSSLYSYQGSAKLNGVELADYAYLGSKHLSYVSSNPTVFTDTVENNIKLDYPCDDLHLDFIDDIHSSKLTHTNQNISGGQISRLMLSRAMAQKSNLVILDNPFQSIDAQKLSSIMKKIRRDERIFLISSNNPIVLSQMDKIIYLHDNTYDVLTYEELKATPFGGKIK